MLVCFLARVDPGRIDIDRLGQRVDVRNKLLAADGARDLADAALEVERRSDGRGGVAEGAVEGRLELGLDLFGDRLLGGLALSHCGVVFVWFEDGRSARGMGKGRGRGATVTEGSKEARRKRLKK